METFSALLAICAGNSPVPGEFPAQRPVTRSFDVFFDLRLNKRLSKQPWGWWFETPAWSLWRHRNECGNCFHVFPPLWSGCSWWVPSSLPERLRDETIKRSSRTGGGAAFGRGMLATCPPWGYMKTVVCFGQTYCRAIINANVACSRITSKKMHIQSTEITNKVLQSISLLSTYWINVSTIALCYWLPFVNKSLMSSPFLSLSYRRITNGLNVSHI